MTLDKAERILARARRWWSDNKGLSDARIARRTEKSCSILAVMLILFTGNMLQSSRRHGDDWSDWWLPAVYILLAVWFLFVSRRYSQIANLFEEAGPQSIADLRASSPAARRDTWPQ